jgi:uncharacterized coiled-coil DUF342 family protein
MTIKTHEKEKIMDEHEIYNIIKSDVKEIKDFIREIRASLKELYEERNKTNDKISDLNSCFSQKMIGLDMQVKELEKDVNNLANSVREHNQSSDPFRDDVKKIQWEIGLAKWLGGIAITLASGTILTLIGIMVKNIFSE